MLSALFSYVGAQVNRFRETQVPSAQRTGNQDETLKVWNGSPSNQSQLIGNSDLDYLRSTYLFLCIAQSYHRFFSDSSENATPTSDCSKFKPLRILFAAINAGS